MSKLEINDYEQQMILDAIISAMSVKGEQEGYVENLAQLWRKIAIQEKVGA